MWGDRRSRMAIAAARLLHDHQRVLVGVGVPNLAANIAKRVHAPDLVLVYESGVIDARPPGLPLSIGDPDLVRTSLGVVPILELFSQYLQKGWIDIGFLGAAQIDRRGNLNSTVIGDYVHPEVRLAGSGGAADIASFTDTIVITPHDRRRFPDRVDFITAAGHPPGGLRRPGPRAVVTDLGQLEFDQDGEMRLVAVFPGVSVSEVQAATAWPLRVAPSLREISEPTAAEWEALSELTAADRQSHD